MIDYFTAHAPNNLTFKQVVEFSNENSDNRGKFLVHSGGTIASAIMFIVKLVFRDQYQAGLMFTQNVTSSTMASK